MPDPTALRRTALATTAGAGLALLGFSFHGMAGLDVRLADAARARDALRNQMVVERHADGLDCPEHEAATGAESAREY